MRRFFGLGDKLAGFVFFVDLDDFATLVETTARANCMRKANLTAVAANRRIRRG